MDRIAKLTNHIDKSGWGIELGPGPNGVAPKRDGYNVHIIDYMSQSDLVKKFGIHDIDVNQIEEVDFVWNGESYAELTQKPKGYDWVVASHVIEHTPDLIGFLVNCDTILKDDGVISLAVPDKRYCFDYFRPLSGLGQIIDAHLQKRTIHTIGSIAEYFSTVVSKGGVAAWHTNHKGEYKFTHSRAEMEETIQLVAQHQTYVDVHAWCFTPSSFRLIIQDLYDLGYSPFQEVAFYETVGCEFFITLGRHGKRLEQSRLALLEQIHAEQLSVLETPNPIPLPKKSIVSRGLQKLASLIP